VPKALALAHRMGDAVRSLGIEHLAAEGRAHVTVSIGVACIHPAMLLPPAARADSAQNAAALPGATEVAQALFEQADTALYNAKKAGRDRVMACPSPQEPLPEPTRTAAESQEPV